MENLQQLMAEVDTISKSIPEGSYLKMCDLMKGLHTGMHNAAQAALRVEGNIHEMDRIYRASIRDPPATDSRRLPVIPPFQAIPTGDYNAICMKIKLIEDRLKTIKIRRNITEAVKREAIRSEVLMMNYGRVPLPLTIEGLRENGVRIPNERLFYKSYIERMNLINQELIQDLNDELDDLNEAKDAIQAMFGF